MDFFWGIRLQGLSLLFIWGESVPTGSVCSKMSGWLAVSWNVYGVWCPEQFKSASKLLQVLLVVPSKWLPIDYPIPPYTIIQRILLNSGGTNHPHIRETCPRECSEFLWDLWIKSLDCIPLAFYDTQPTYSEGDNGTSKSFGDVITIGIKSCCSQNYIAETKEWG